VTRARPSRAGLPLVLLGLPVALTVACSAAPPSGDRSVAPPAASTAASTADRAAATTDPAVAAVPTGVEAVAAGSDPAVSALRTYLREQALAVNAGTADPAALPAFTASVTVAARGWAVPLLAANLGDRMPGPYPVGVLATDVVGGDRVVLSICLQDRGWQVDAQTGRAVNPERFGTASATVLRVDDRWLVDDVVADGGTCTAADVVREVF